MKKIAVIAMLMLAAVNVYSQKVTRPEKLYQSIGGHMLAKATCEDSTNYFISIRTNNDYYGREEIILGNKDNSIRLITWLIEAKELKYGDVIELENPSNNRFIYRKTLGSKMYYVYPETSDDIYGTLPIIYLEKMKKILQVEK